MSRATGRKGQWGLGSEERSVPDSSVSVFREVTPRPFGWGRGTHTSEDPGLLVAYPGKRPGTPGGVRTPKPEGRVVPRVGGDCRRPRVPPGTVRGTRPPPGTTQSTDFVPVVEPDPLRHPASDSTVFSTVTWI